jgi:TonB-dependent starch-binding outer membrane protein SusC
MRETREIAMEETVPKRQSFKDTPLRVLRAIGTSVLLVMLFAGSALAQSTIAVSGTVSGAGGAPLSGVTVRISGTETRVLTNATGRYTITAPANGALTYTLIGQKPVREDIGGRTRIDVRMEGVTYLEEVVVTAYTEQRRADITGAVASINVESAARQSGASVLQKLDAVPGITVAASGSPGSRSTVRIRGISSFQNNEPLYVVDGVPLQDSYINWLNPADITSIQVLKDASASSIYGSRASNGVIVIETTRRGVTGAPRVTASLRTGLASPTRGYDDFVMTDAMQYFQVIKESYTNAGLAIPTNVYGDPNNPSIPAFVFAETGTYASKDPFGRFVGVDVNQYSFPNRLIMPGSAGTNWWKAVFGTGALADYNVNVAGGSPENTYSVSANYFNQAGTAAFNRFRRGTLRANTAFTRGKISLGENVAIAAERAVGGLGDDAGGETGIMGKNILSNPVVPVYDVAGNFASGKANTTGNNTNPLKVAYESRNNLNKNNRVFGNVFAGYALTPKLSFRSSLGFTGTQGGGVGYNAPTFENSEPTTINSFNENQNSSTDWTWSNTARFNHTMSQHTFNVLLGQEANQARNRFLNGGITSLINTGIDTRYVQDALGDSKTKTVSSGGGQSSLLSYFGKADYNYGDKYVASFTVRRDGSSRLSPDHRWGTFPAVGLGWRVSKEGFLEGNHVLSDAMLRVGWGVTGNQNIPAGRILPQFGGAVQETYYDINGTNSVVPGYRQTVLGNPDLKWEENRSTNVGADLALFDGAINVVLDFYQRNTNNLLYNPGLPGTAGTAAAPIVNIGKMKNTGVDFSVGHTGTNWNATFQGTHYKNEIVAINGDQQSFFGPNGTRLPGNPVINQLGNPISSFYGYKVEGYFQTDAEVAASAVQNGKPGRLKFADLNGDKKIDALDRTIIGNPHPDFTGSLDLGYRYGNFDVSSTVFGSFGNDIFDAQKDFYVFRDFSTTVVKDRVSGSWSTSNPDAKYPKLDENDTHSREISSFYIEDGSYVRLRNIQLGYTVPQSLARWVSAARIYVQAENLFTITGYEGLDPSLPVSNNNANGADIRDQYRGIDRGSYPSNRIFSIGLTTSF